MRHRILTRGIVCGALLLTALLGAGLGFAPQIVLAPFAPDRLPSFVQVRAQYGGQGSETRILDRHGLAVQRLRNRFDERRGDWVAQGDVSVALRNAIIRSEDRHFYTHHGVDGRALFAALLDRLGGRPRGASTITMQLAGLLDSRLRAADGHRSLWQKWRQMATAVALEHQWNKAQILEAYLNIVPFRGEAVGVDALSRDLFSKAPHALDRQEAAIAAALIRAPNASAKQVAVRACTLLRTGDHADGHHTPAFCAGLRVRINQLFDARGFAPSQGIAYHFARRLLRAAGSQAPIVLNSTLDRRIQRVAYENLRQALLELEGRHVYDGAAVVIDNASGDVLAWVGAVDANSSAPEVDSVQAPRQPGSALKPLLYAAAISEQRLTAASLLDDIPTEIPTASGLYIPENYDHRFRGWISVRTALAASLNIPAVRTLVMLGPDHFAEYLDRFGIHLREIGGYYGYSLALGSTEVTLLELANAYRTLANGGRSSPVRLQPDDPRQPSVPVLDPGAAWIVGDILSDPVARAPTFGTASVLATPFWTAVKTGTSKDMRDNWAVGWSQRYTVGVWVGNADGTPMRDVSGVSGAAPVWAAIMGALHAEQGSVQPTPPVSVRAAEVRFRPAVEVSRREWFIAGTEQDEIRLTDDARDADTAAGVRLSKPPAPPATPAHITAPADGSIIAIDPDIPPHHQRVVLSSNVDAVRWRIDDVDLGSGRRLLWFPLPGRHRIQLTSFDGRALDSVRLEVRGAGLDNHAWDQIRRQAPEPYATIPD